MVAQWQPPLGSAHLISVELRQNLIQCLHLCYSLHTLRFKAESPSKRANSRCRSDKLINVHRHAGGPVPDEVAQSVAPVSFVARSVQCMSVRAAAAMRTVCPSRAEHPCLCGPPRCLTRVKTLSTKPSCSQHSTWPVAIAPSQLDCPVLSSRDPYPGPPKEHRGRRTAAQHSREVSPRTSRRSARRCHGGDCTGAGAVRG